MRIFDGHNDTLTRLYLKETNDIQAFIRGSRHSHIDLPRARQGELAGGFFAISVPPPEDSPERDPMYGVTFTDKGYITAERSPLDQAYAETFTDTLLERAQLIETASQGALAIIRDYGQLLTCLDHGIFAVVLHLEGAEAIRPDLKDLATYYERGVRSLGLVWRRPNAFGYGVPFRFPDTPDIGPGLTDAGIELVKQCNAMGILIDLAHMNAQGFRDVAHYSVKPLVVTHADVHAICPSTRNLTDWQIDGEPSVTQFRAFVLRADIAAALDDTPTMNRYVNAANAITVSEDEQAEAVEESRRLAELKT